MKLIRNIAGAVLAVVALGCLVVLAVIIGRVEGLQR
jgi:hypothetical protein